MNRITKYVAVVLCLFNFSSIRAQDTTDVIIKEVPSIELDSAYMTEGYVESYDRKEFGYFDSVPRISTRKIEADAISRVRADEAYWYANVERKTGKKEKAPEVSVEKNNWFNTLFWILLVGGFVALLVWLLSGSNINLFRRSAPLIEEEEEEPGENIFELNFDREIQAAIAAKNYRLAVRLMYLQVLRLMADKGIIEYTAEKTNSDYLLQLSNTKFYKGFSRLTRNFDYVWYGKFPLSPENFDLLREDFSTFKKSVG